MSLSPAHPKLSPVEGTWLPAGTMLSLTCKGPGPRFLLMGPGSGPLETINSHHFAAFGSNNLTKVTSAHSGTYTCHCQDPPNPPGPPSNTVEVVVYGE